MNDLSAEEVRARLKAITQGPWAQGVVRAREALAPVDPISISIKGLRPIALDVVGLSRSNKLKSGRLSRVLRSHFEQGVSIEDQKEILTRDALDEALTVPQLYELAVQTGYLPERTIRTPARSVLTGLLWSEAARRFVAAYDYVAVPMLAARVGVLGLGVATPPEPNPNGALHFAGFLAHLRAFYGDTEITVWERFLDDYVVEKNEQHVFREYLEGRRPAPPARAEALLSGCHQFVTSLASAFHVLTDEELGHFALVHAYSLQRFFGYKRDAAGLYVKDVATWGRTDSWAQTIATSPHLLPADVPASIRKVARKQFGEQVQVTQQAFEALKRLVRETRQPALVTTALLTEQSRRGLGRHTIGARNE